MSPSEGRRGRGQSDWRRALMQLTGGRAVDVVLDNVGGADCEVRTHTASTCPPPPLPFAHLNRFPSFALLSPTSGFRSSSAHLPSSFSQIQCFSLLLMDGCFPTPPHPGCMYPLPSPPPFFSPAPPQIPSFLDSSIFSPPFRPLPFPCPFRFSSKPNPSVLDRTYLIHIDLMLCRTGLSSVCSFIVET